MPQFFVLFLPSEGTDAFTISILFCLAEWFFRASLDRYIWIYGMICAYIHPAAEKALKALDELPAFSRRLGRAILVAVTLGIGALWYHKVYLLPKLEYNVLHPYTSWIPITVFIALRNLTPPMRTWSMGLYGWLGCITLETCETGMALFHCILFVGGLMYFLH